MANDYYSSILTLYYAAKRPRNLYASFSNNQIKHLLREPFRLNELDAIKIIDEAVDSSVLYQEGGLCDYQEG
eukprot:scaffold323_cov181-Ochromonas_danica.AAC.19